jgi:hypothetical protein
VRSSVAAPAQLGDVPQVEQRHQRDLGRGADLPRGADAVVAEPVLGGVGVRQRLAPPAATQGDRALGELDERRGEAVVDLRGPGPGLVEQRMGARRGRAAERAHRCLGAQAECDPPRLARREREPEVARLVLGHADRRGHRHADHGRPAARHPEAIVVGSRPPGRAAPAPDPQPRALDQERDQRPAPAHRRQPDLAQHFIEHAEAPVEVARAHQLLGGASP